MNILLSSIEVTIHYLFPSIRCRKDSHKLKTQPVERTDKNCPGTNLSEICLKSANNHYTVKRSICLPDSLACHWICQTQSFAASILNFSPLMIVVISLPKTDAYQFVCESPIVANHIEIL